MRYNLQVGKLADLVLWNPALFGSKPEIVVKGGQIAWSQMGKKRQCLLLNYNDVLFLIEKNRRKYFFVIQY